jgi:membrane-associated phospholipid phosphatase
MYKTFKNLSVLMLISFFSSSILAQTDNWELNYLRNREANRTPGKTGFYNGISASMYVFTIAPPVTYLIAGLAKDDIVFKKTALYLFESAAIAQAISFSTKAIVNRERPGVKYPTLTPVNKVKNASFPSGHTSGAFALATSLTIVHPKWYVAIPSFAWAGMVGYSRLYLGVHYPTDVLAGAVVGAGSAWLSFRLNKWMHKSKNNKLVDSHN